MEENTASSDNFHMATVLSKYCAYFVAFSPELFPNHVNISGVIYHHHLYSEAKKLFKGCNFLNGSKYKKLMAVSEEHCLTILGKGGRLAQRLINEIGDEAKRWKVLADFWEELIVFLAPSESTIAHAEYLDMG
ncbi:hypothetical protein Ancab_033560, partial [Ancistrocladus abbreviatus]